MEEFLHVHRAGRAQLGFLLVLFLQQFADIVEHFLVGLGGILADAEVRVVSLSTDVSKRLMERPHKTYKGMRKHVYIPLGESISHSTVGLGLLSSTHDANISRNLIVLATV